MHSHECLHECSCINSTSYKPNKHRDHTISITSVAIQLMQLKDTRAVVTCGALCH